MDSSRSNIAPVLKYRSARLMPRLFKRPARSGWSLGVALTACCPILMDSSRSSIAPVLEYQPLSLIPRLFKYMA
ncbi:hypothetical protein BDW72DRAFT_174527 [Aspergillus terricola var. indicus]